MRPDLTSLMLQAPAKINGFLTIEGFRPDGFHDLVSLVAQIDLCDSLTVNWSTQLGRDSLEIVGADLPADDSNTVLKAVRVFREAYPFPGHVRWTLQKAIPSGAGLGGGSSDAAAAIIALNRLWGNPLSSTLCQSLGEKIGSDVSLFFGSSPCVIRAKGELLEPCPTQFLELLKQWQIFIFKPAFSISTSWAYQVIKNDRLYTDLAGTEAILNDFESTLSLGSGIFTNDFLRVIGSKYPVIPILLDKIVSQLKLPCGLSGSGSACFALFKEHHQLVALQSLVDEAWGAHAFRIATRFLIH